MEGVGRTAEKEKGKEEGKTRAQIAEARGPEASPRNSNEKTEDARRDRSPRAARLDGEPIVNTNVHCG